MTTLISLDNQVPWTPPVARPQKSRVMKPPPQPQRQGPRKAATATFTQRGPTTDGVVIELSSDEEDSDTDEADDDAYMAFVASTKDARTKSAGKQCQIDAKAVVKGAEADHFPRERYSGA